MDKGYPPPQQTQQPPVQQPQWQQPQQPPYPVQQPYLPQQAPLPAQQPPTVVVEQKPTLQITTENIEQYSNGLLIFAVSVTVLAGLIFWPALLCSALGISFAIMAKTKMKTDVDGFTTAKNYLRISLALTTTAMCSAIFFFILLIAIVAAS